MDLSKLKSPRGVPTGSGSNRLIVLTVVTLIVLGAYLYFNYQAHLPQDEGVIDPGTYSEIPHSIRLPGAKVDLAKLSEIKDKDLAQRVIKETEPYHHLVQQAARLVYGDMELLGARKALWEEIVNDPQAFRGKPLEIKGNLQWFEKTTFNEVPLYRGSLVSKDGKDYYFTILNMPAEIKVHDVVKLQGFFFKLYSFNAPEDDRRIDNAVFLVGKQLIPSFYQMEPVTTLDMDLLNSIYDYDILDLAKYFEEKPLYHILSYVQNMDKETLQKIDFGNEVLPPEILRKPDQYRGKPVKILGEIVLMPVEKVLGPDGENPLNTARCYHGVLLNYRGGKMGFCYFISLEKPAWMKKDDLVYMKGFFFRNYAYRTQNENLQPAPLIIVSGFEKFVLPEDNTIAYFSIGILGVSFLISLYFFMNVMKDRKHNQQYREKFIANKKKQLSRVLKKEEQEKESASASHLEKTDSSE
ncbi:MAG: hypothetical protein ABIK28_18105 [Planctomycetota bacterium]